MPGSFPGSCQTAAVVLTSWALSKLLGFPASLRKVRAQQACTLWL